MICASAVRLCTSLSFYNIRLEGSVSQIFYLSPGSHFMSKMSLGSNVFNLDAKFQVGGISKKRDIHIQKIKVKKTICQIYHLLSQGSSCLHAHFLRRVRAFRKCARAIYHDYLLGGCMEKFPGAQF